MDTTTIVYLSAEAIVGFLSVVGNCLVLTVILRTRQLHTITNVFVGNLAIADIVVGVLVGPCAALSFLGLPHNFYGCVFINCLILMFTNVSILMLMSVAIERFIAIKEPFVYQRLLTVRRAIYVNLCVWVVGSALGLCPMYGWHRGYRFLTLCAFTEIVNYQYMVYFQFFGLVLVPLFIMLCIYIYILIIVRKHTRQTNALHSHLQKSKDSKDTFNKDVKAAKMFALVILLFGILWLPVNLFNCVSLFCGLNCPFPLQGLLVTIVMSHANSSINPFLYAASNSRIKRGIKELFGIKVNPEDRNTTDYETKRPPTKGTSFARNNSVAPISSVTDLVHYFDDSVRAFSQKSLTVNNKTSVQPIDHHQHNENVTLPNAVGETINTTNQQNVPTQHDSGSNGVVSWSSQVSNIESLQKSQDLVSLSSLHDNHKKLEAILNSRKGSGKSSTTPPKTPVSLIHLHENHRSDQNGPSSLSQINNSLIDLRQDDNLYKTTSNKNDNEGQQMLLKCINNAAVRTASDNRINDNIACWTTSSSFDTHNGSMCDREDEKTPHPQIENGRRHSDIMNLFQKTSVSSELCEELNVQKLNGYVSTERTIRSLSSHENILTKNGDLTLHARSDNITTSNSEQVLDNESAFKSPIRFPETFGDSET